MYATKLMLKASCSCLLKTWTWSWLTAGPDGSRHPFLLFKVLGTSSSGALYWDGLVLPQM